MTPETKKQFNLLAGVLFGVLGMGCFGVAAYVASVPAEPKPAPVQLAPTVNVASCRDVLQSMGYSTRMESGGVSANDAALDDPQAALTRATAAIGVCKMALDTFCMGEACPEPGVSFKLVPAPRSGAAKPAVPVAAAASAAASAAPAGEKTDSAVKK
jgi:hypothetical protein